MSPGWCSHASARPGWTLPWLTGRCERIPPGASRRSSEPSAAAVGQGPPELSAKVVAGAPRAIARFGLAKLTVDDVARQAGISRATLYRYFPGRGAVLAAVVRSETERLQRGLDEALGDVTSLPEALAAVAGFGARAFVGHEALQH